MTWRDSAAPIIAGVIQRVGREDMAELHKALREAYPFGERRRWPYKVWRDEIRRQLGHRIVAHRSAPAAQGDLFENVHG